MNLRSKNLLILASAGSGKTYQLGNRIIGLVAGGAEVEKIVALTFTRKAAGEFTDSVLSKLAKAATDEATANQLREELQMPETDFQEVLAKVTRALPRLTLGTMDGFFSRVVRGFQYELGLTGGRFDLLEGQRAAAAADDLLAEILGELMEGEAKEEFFHAFRRATIGKEGVRVMESLRGFVNQWLAMYRSHAGLEWGPGFLAGVEIGDWEKHKASLAEAVRRGLDGIEETRKGQREALGKAIDTLAAHTIGSGSLGSPKGMLASVLEQAQGDGAMELKYYNAFCFNGPSADALRSMARLVVSCEMAAACLRTHAVRGVISVFDKLAETRLRKRGLLGFDDVKRLMGGWIMSEDARLRREAVDFRLDARYEHWLLDEFQDTSREDWLGLSPLIDEAASGEDGTVFVVGDRKQAIYGWRGGDVGLFDEISRRYGSGLETGTMVESWRSCPEVLELVNRVCGNRDAIRELFPGTADRWEWEDHISANPEKRGEARVEIVEGEREGRFARTVEILRELEIGECGLSCGILLRTGSLVREMADLLRAEGFDVIEEGKREPAKDHPVGVVLWHLIKWLANPADAFARRVLEMSPLESVLVEKFGPEPWRIWEGVSSRVAESGFVIALGEIIAPLWPDWSDFGRRRAGDILSALRDFEASGGVTAREAADWIGRLEISQSPGLAAVQVMTIHKSKGLGFDAVILPEIPDEVVPNARHFTVAKGEGWISEVPARWVRDLIPELREAEKSWGAAQRYEALCALYVALTRAKRGLYVLLDVPSASGKEGKASLSGLLRASFQTDGSPGVMYRSGEADWVKEISRSGADAEKKSSDFSLGAAVPRRERFAPSRHDSGASKVLRNKEGAEFGRKIHAAFEAVGWLDEEAPDFPEDEEGAWVSSLLEKPELRQLFERKGRSVSLLREQALDAVVEGRWLSGVVDRLHLHHDAGGTVEKLEIIDFKTDAVDRMEELQERHTPQMQAYGKALALAYPGVEIECILVSTKLGTCGVIRGGGL